MGGRETKRMKAKLFQAARKYASATKVARSRGQKPLKNKRERETAFALLEEAAKFQKEWSAWTTERGRPPILATVPLPPPQTKGGALVRAAKAFGYSNSRKRPERNDMARLLLRAAEEIPEERTKR